MFNVFRKDLKIGDSVVSFETGLIANESDVAVIVKCRENTVLCTLNINKESSSSDFFPLTVNYIEKYYAAGKIPKGFNKREGRMTQREILVSRLIDRAIRPCFEDDFMQETGIACTLLSYDGKIEVDILAALGVAVALKISGIQMKNFTVSSRVGYIDGEYILNPSSEQIAKSQMDVVVACTKDCVMMLEGEFNELPKEIVLGALKFALAESSSIIDFIDTFASEVGIRNCFPFKKKDYTHILDEINTKFLTIFKEAVLINIKNKSLRKEKIDAVKKKIVESFKDRIDTNEILERDVMLSISKIEESIVRGKVLSERRRLDGRALDEIREIDIRNNILPVVHGSSLFTRGRTQVLSVTTLGGESDEQLADSFTDPVTSERFALHYNFNPYSCGDSASPRAPGRREIGHGRLAYKGLKCLIPSREDFPYSIRNVAEVTGSDGSTSMATLCSGCLSLLSTGVPLRNYVAGIAMGLIKEQKEFLVLTDIMAEEDYLGDMDFKVIATDRGINAIQMDLKVDGISLEIMENAFNEALVATDKILMKMKNSTGGLNVQDVALSKNAPKFAKFKIEDKNVPILIGKGGNTIKEISKNFSVKININKDNFVEIFEDGVTAKVEEAKAYITHMLQADNRRPSHKSGEARGEKENNSRYDHDKKDRPSKVEIDQDFFSTSNRHEDRHERKSKHNSDHRFSGSSRFNNDRGDRNHFKKRREFDRKNKKPGFLSKIIRKIKGN